MCVQSRVVVMTGKRKTLIGILIVIGKPAKLSRLMTKIRKVTHDPLDLISKTCVLEERIRNPQYFQGRYSSKGKS